MSHLIVFTTSTFDISGETPNPINPIHGQSILSWLREQISTRGFDVSEPEPEDWGWFIDVSSGNASYMVGASGEVEEHTPDVEWIVQVHKTRSLMEKIMGKNKMVSEDPVSAIIEKAVRALDGARDIQVEVGKPD